MEVVEVVELIIEVDEDGCGRGMVVAMDGGFCSGG